MLPIVLCGVLPFNALLLQLLAHKISEAKAAAHSPLHLLPNTRAPSRDTAILMGLQTPCCSRSNTEALSPRCQSVTFSPTGWLSGNENQPKLDHTYNHSTTGKHGYCPNRIDHQQLLWQDGLKSTQQLDLGRMDNPMVCLECYRRHRLNVNQKEKSTDHQHINGLSLAFSAHCCLVWDAGLSQYGYFRVSKL